MKKASIDNENWARLVQEIQQAKDAFEMDGSRAEVEPVTSHVQTAQQVPVAAEPDPGLADAPGYVSGNGSSTVPGTLPSTVPGNGSVIAVNSSANDAASPAINSQPTFDRHELADNMDEFLGSDAQAVQQLSNEGRSGIRSHLGWGVGGFLLGAICWHLVGFWDFVGDVVLSGPQTTSVVERNVEPRGKPMVLGYEKRRAQNNSIESSKNCSAFFQDLETGLAHSTKCQAIVRSPGTIGSTSKR